MRKSIFLLVALLAFASQAAHADPLKSMARQLAKGASQLKNPRIAVLVFPYENGDVSSGSTLVSERLTTLLSGHKHLNVIERSRLASVLGEMRLEESGVTGSTDSPKLGEILNVEAVVTGSLHDSMEGKTEINARLIRVETGEILAAASARIDRTWDDRPQPPVGPEEEDDDHYVMHESPLIFTPQGGRHGMLPPATQVAYADSPGSAYASSAYTSAPSVGNAMAIASAQAAQPAHYYGGVPNGRAEMLYAMGLTLDAQGHRQQAKQFYQRMLSAPAPAALRERAESRLASHNSSRVQD